MDKEVRRRLEAAGIDVDDALSRFLDNEALMTKYLCRFPQDPNMDALRRAIAAGDGSAGFEAAHTLKGVAGNLSLVTLFHQISPLVEDLRAGNLAAAAEKLPAVEAAYAAVKEALAVYVESVSSAGRPAP